MNSMITLDRISKSFLTNKKITVLNKISYKIKFVDNFYNNNQLIIGIEAFDEIELNNVLSSYSDVIANKINKTLFIFENNSFLTIKHEKV